METPESKTFDVAVIGGGLSGLTLSILLARKGLRVVLFEKNKYPFHRVCGEYISNESRNFLEKMGLPFAKLSLPEINKLTLTAPDGYAIHGNLDLGGFGISRFELDHHLCQLAEKAGVEIWQNCKVTQVENAFDFQRVTSTKGLVNVRLVCGSFGKYSPSFIDDSGSKVRSNFIGVKYHIRHDHDADRISLHNFKDGYCGISKVENGKSCLCYLTTSENLKQNGNQIRRMEESILFRNPHLKQIFEKAEFLFEQPIAISNIHFQPRHSEKNGIIMLGDAAGTIAPLSGNGMSMAMHSAAILAPLIEQKFAENHSFEWLKTNYSNAWNQNFQSRIGWGYRLQQLFGNPHWTRAALGIVGNIPPLFRKLISLTHGSPF